jgi:polyribonucleotide nucleotidyltransferase
MLLMDKKIFKFEEENNTITLETGRLAKQADAAVMVTSGGTQVLVTVVSAKEAKDGQDWFPLTVDYNEKFYAAGKFLGGFMKREARPTLGETLASRLIDRPLRPLFPEGYLNDTFIQATVYSYDEEHDPEVLASMGAAAALNISDIPFECSLGTCKVGKLDGKLVINPAHSRWEESELEVLVSATKDAIMMVEGEAKLVSEDEMLEALDAAHDYCRKFCAFLDDMVKSCGKKKREFTPVLPNKTLLEKVTEKFSSDARDVINTDIKQERSNATRLMTKKIAEAVKAAPGDFGLTEDDDAGKAAYAAVDELLYDMMRADILKESKRIGKRKLDEIRDIEVEAGVLSTPHGSSLFTRGETQVMAMATLGGSAGDQMVDSIRGLTYNKFYLHYSFPPFSVGEARGVRGVSRREHGHGNLAERAIKNVLPSQEDFSYTIRLACDVLESNGSSSMGSVCSGSMALMDAGVPLKAPVAGIAMGLIKDGDDYAILSDILGDEDHLGDMDFKVAGSEDGITAIQMDIKITGITREIFQKALAQAKAGRLHILEQMAKAISTARPDFKNGVPRMESLSIPSDKIGALIGPGGKNIKGIQEKFEVTLEVDDDGLVKILGQDRAVIEEVKTLVDMQINGPKIGDTYEAKVVTIKEYGAFVDIVPGVSGLVHISEFSDKRVEDVNDYVKEGDDIKVKVLEQDKFGRLKLSAKAAQPLEKRAES